jgi:membrane associated rhomboid family serine protease
MSSGADLFVVCKSCGSEVSPYITECPYCGSRLRKRAPKLDRGGEPRERRFLRPPRARASLGRLRAGEMPGIRLDSRPYVSIAAIVASVGVSVAVQTSAVSAADLAIAGKPTGEWWHVATAPLVYLNTGYALVALLAIALFGWLLERRHGHLAAAAVFLAGGAGGMAVASVAESVPFAAGGNGAALALLCAWAVPDLLERRRGGETESDLLGALVIFGVVALIPLAAEEADWIAGGAGAAIGLVSGALLNVAGRHRSAG